MRILVVGDGKVGHTLAEQLTREGHDVVVIDNNETVLQRCEDALDVMCIQGNGANEMCIRDSLICVGKTSHEKQTSCGRQEKCLPFFSVSQRISPLDVYKRQPDSRAHDIGLLN